MAPGLDESAHWDALAAILRAVTVQSADLMVCDVGMVPGDSDGNVPGTMPDLFAQLQVERRNVPADRSGRSGRSGWRVSVRLVARYPKNTRDAQAAVQAALDGIRVTVDGHESTPLHHELSQAVRPDDGMFSGLVQVTYAL